MKGRYVGVLRKAAVFLLGGMLLTGLLSGCEAKQGVAAESFNVYSNLVQEAPQSALQKALTRVEVSPDLFLERVRAFNTSMDAKCNLTEDWAPLPAESYDQGQITACWEQAFPDQMDTNCRIAAFALVKDQIRVSRPYLDYGTYLMFDMEAIDTYPQLEPWKAERSAYMALFDEVKIPEGMAAEGYGGLFPQAWQARGVSFPEASKGLSLITLVMTDPDSGVLFTGHTGVLLDEPETGGYLFAEKLSPLRPYQLTRLADKKALATMLLSRKNYYTYENGPAPLIYENSALLQDQ